MSEQPIKTYVISKGNQIARVVMSVLGIAGGALFFAEPYLEPSMSDLGRLIFFYVFGLLLLMLSVYILLNTYKFRLEIWSDKIQKTSILGVTEIRIKDIDSYRAPADKYGNHNVYILESAKTNRKIRIFLMLDHNDEFIKWVKHNFKNDDDIETEKETEEVLNDEKLGTTKAQREENLANAKKWMKILAGISLGMAAWAYLAPRPYEFVIWFLIMWPVLIIFSLNFFPETVRFNVRQSSVYASIDAPLSIPIFLLALRALQDWNILYWSHFWVPFSAFMLFLLILFFAFSTDVRKKVSSIIFAVFLCGLYGYGTAISLNGILDHSLPDPYPSVVLDKRVGHGRHSTTYYMTLPPWGTVSEQKEYRVNLNVYRQRSVGDSVTVALKSGAFQIPFYYIY